MSPRARQAIECGTAEVHALLAFVSARAVEDELMLEAEAVRDEALPDVLLLADTLLEIAADRCSADIPCPLTANQVRALARVASLHSQHPDFRRGWLGLRSPRGDR